MGKKKEKYVPKRGLIGDAIDYHVYEETLVEKLLWFLIGTAAGVAVAYVFYENLILCIVAAVACGFAFIPIRRKQVINKRKKELNLQFREMLDSLATSIGSGKNVFNAFSDAVQDLTVQFGENANIVNEVKIICAGLNSNIQIEDLLTNFAERAELEDVKNFAEVFATAYKKGGNIKEIMRNTSTIIGDKIEVQMELETMVAGQKNEQNIMLVMPVIFIVVMKSMGGDLVDLNSPVGILSVTAAIGIFALAYFISTKILDIKL